MDDFLRPELRAALWRWREVILAGLVAALGLWWGLGSYGILRWLGWAVAAGSAALAWTAVQRLRFARGGGGQGVVTVDEARVVYYGPFGGGVSDLGDLLRLDLDGASRPPHWWLIGGDGSALAIPLDAEGADALFDAFAGLPGLSSAALVTAAATPEVRRRTVWTRSRALTGSARPH